MKLKSPPHPTDETNKTLLKKSTCPNLLGTAEIQYEITDTPEGIQLRLTGSSGNGYYSKAWVSLDSILENLEAFAAKYPLVSLALKEAYPAYTSTNSWGFMMAVLLAEGLVERLEDNQRHFRLCDPAPFLASLEKLKASHSPPVTGKPKKKAKASSRMRKTSPKASAGK
jgi:hypothetical protein